MKRRTLWIVGITTTIITVVSLSAVLGSRYQMYNRYHHHWCMEEGKDRQNKTAPSSESKSDTTHWR